MTLELQERDEQRILDIIVDWESANVSPLLIFKIGGEDYSDLIPEGSVKQDGMAIVLDVTFADNLPLRLYGAPVSLSVSIEGIEIPMMQGLVSLPQPNDDDVTTKFLAASAGSLADKHPLNERVEYSGASPRFVVQDALRRLPYEDRIEVENVESPTLYFARGNAEGPFERYQGVNDILSKVGEKVPFVFRDTAWGGHKAFVSTGLATIPEVPDYLQFRAEELLFWKSPALALDQYARVIVHRENPDGSDAFEPVVLDVTYTGRDFPPPIGSTFLIPFTEDASAALKLGYDKVKELARGLYKSGPTLPFYPLLERTDAFSVAEGKYEEGKLYERLWLHYVDAWAHAWGEGFDTKPACSVTLLDEDEIKAPTLNLGLISGGTSGGIIRALWGQSPQGFMYFDESLAWITESGDYFTIDESASGGVVTTSGDYFTVN